MIKRSDKRGEGPSYSMVLIIIAIAILLIVLLGIFGISNATEKGLTTFGVDMIDQKVVACNLHATSALKDSFCGYRYIDKNTYMNCMYEDVVERLIEDELTMSEINAFGCEQTQYEFCLAVCRGEEKDSGNNVIKFNEAMTVNGITCESLGLNKEKCDEIAPSS